MNTKQSDKIDNKLRKIIFKINYKDINIKFFVN